MCNKAVVDYSIALEFVLDWYKTQEMCDIIISYDPDQYKSQQMCDKAVDDFYQH